MTINKLQNDILELKKIIILKDRQISDLLDTIKILQRKKFAPSSESSKEPDQIFNELEEIAEGDEGKDEESEDEPDLPSKKKRGKRKPLAEDLPRIETIIDLSDEEKIGMKFIGEEISEQLVIEPAKIYVKRIIRKKYAPIDNTGVIKVAPLPATLLPKSMASASLIAYILTAKFVDALPLFRQEKILARISADVTRQSMARWVIQVSDIVVPLYNLLQDRLLGRDYMQMDETTTQVLNEVGKKATSKSYMWVRFAPGEFPIVLYDYAPTRAGTVPLELLEGFSGALQVDGYDGYASACDQYGLNRLGCMDHCRRKFFDASKTSGGKNIGKKGVNLIDKLYEIEEKIENLSLEERYSIRQEKSVPLLVEIKSWIDEVRSEITPKSVAGKAIHYAFNEWQYLIKYTENPAYNISNILIENAIRPFALGRKNWLFSASVDGAKASAMFYSLIETAKKNGLEPFDYLSKMLEKLPMAKTVDDFEKLLPLRGIFQV